MRNEALAIIRRRFMSRQLESALLILAVALGVGAAASGLSLLANTGELAADMLESPEYRQIVVSTQSNAADMETPAAKKPTTENVILTYADLKAAEVVPDVTAAYISNETDMRFLNQATIDRESGMRAEFASQGGNTIIVAGVEPKTADSASQTANAETSGSASVSPATADTGGAVRNTAPEAGTGAGVAATDGAGTENQMVPEGENALGPRPENGPGGFGAGVNAEAFEAAMADSATLIVDLDELRGYEVTPEFFDAWNMQASIGSLFTQSDMNSEESLVVLGSSTAEIVAGDLPDTSGIVGKKLLTWRGYVTIVGILAPTGEAKYDQSFFAPYELASTAFSENGPPRRFAFNTRLNFAVADPAQLASAGSLLSEWFSSNYGEGQITVTNPRAEAEKLIARNTGIGALILFLALAGLFIASVNVSNILMSRGIRMKKNTGILMALGASRERILRLFSAEALAVSGIGAAIGVALAIPMSASMQSALGMETGNGIYILVGVLAASALTLAFSLIPAVQNSRYNPADSMRGG